MSLVVTSRLTSARGRSQGAAMRGRVSGREAAGDGAPQHGIVEARRGEGGGTRAQDAVILRTGPMRTGNATGVAVYTARLWTGTRGEVGWCVGGQAEGGARPGGSSGLAAGEATCFGENGRNWGVSSRTGDSSGGALTSEPLAIPVAAHWWPGWPASEWNRLWTQSAAKRSCAARTKTRRTDWAVNTPGRVFGWRVAELDARCCKPFAYKQPEFFVFASGIVRQIGGGGRTIVLGWPPVTEPQVSCRRASP